MAIKSDPVFPMTLPNAARNVIVHEIGHAIGLGHDNNSAMPMCGRPASCRPNAFASPVEHYFSLTREEKVLLLEFYPADWKAR
ncbi:MAG: hypothetical protein EXR07_20730 [Acetobacteraceae bacterium]|nr:hypothetical protein [Acetobacteraceae bacterium]